MRPPFRLQSLQLQMLLLGAMTAPDMSLRCFVTRQSVWKWVAGGGRAEKLPCDVQHLLTFLELKQPGPIFRAFVLMTQGIFFNLYFLYVSTPLAP